MQIDHVSLIYFSPTSTTSTILHEIAKGVSLNIKKDIDMTPEENRREKTFSFKNELVIIGSPVYSGRIPADVSTYLKKISGSGSPAVIVILYGNREFEDALLELRDIAVRQGLAPVAAAAFIGEHSFSSDEFVISKDRPDEIDLKKAFHFGRQIAGILEQEKSFQTMTELKVPGNFPYKDARSSKGVPFLKTTEDCNGCGICLSVCPKNCIDESDHYATDDSRCIRCCACVKVCPENARVMKDGPIKDIARWLSENCRERKEPQLFFPA